MNIRTEGIGKRFAAFITAMSIAMALIPVSYLNAFAAEDFSGGTGTQSNPYIIKTAADLKTLADKVNAGNKYEGEYFKVGTYTETYTYTENDEEKTGTREKVYDIDLSAYSTWTPIGNETNPFKGNFDGNGGQISKCTFGLGSENSRVQTAGLFGYIEGAKLENIRIANNTVGDVNCNTYAGEGEAYYCIGNLVGFAKDSAIEYCTNYSALNVTAAMGDEKKQPKLYVGGMVGGESGSAITRCINKGAVTVGFGGANLPDIYAGGVVGCASGTSTVTGSENESAITVKNAAEGMRVYAGGIVGGAEGISRKEMLEICQCYNRGGGGILFQNAAGNPITYAGGILGYDDPEQYISVHDCKNDGFIRNNVTSSNTSDIRYAGGIVAGSADVSNCMNTGIVVSTRRASGISYSVPHHCYATGPVSGPEAGSVCAGEPSDKNENYYNYFTVETSPASDSNWQHYVSDSSRLKSGEITWLLQGNQDPAYLHWIQVTQHIGEWPEGQPILGGGYNVYYESNGKYGDRPLDYWLKRGGSWYNKMLKERVDFGYAYSRRVYKVRFVTTEKDGNGLADNHSFESYEDSDTTYFLKIVYANYQGIVTGDMPTLTETDANNKVFQRWVAVNGKNETKTFGGNIGVGANTTVYAYGRVKFGSKDNDEVYRSVYNEGNTIDLSDNMQYGAEPDDVKEKFAYNVKDITAEDSDGSEPEDYFTIKDDTLTVAQNTPVGVYAVTVTATEKSQNITLFSTEMGLDPVDFTVNVEVTEADTVANPAPQTKTRVYDGTADDVITAGSTEHGKMVYTLTPDDDTSWSETVPQGTNVGLYNVYWKIIGDHNHKDTSPDVLSGLIIPDDSDPKNAIIITPTADWDYNGDTKPLATVNQKPDYAEIEWSTDNAVWTNTIPTGCDAGSYPVYWRTKANAYSEVQKGNFTVKVNKAKLTVTPPEGLTKKYNGQAQELIKAGSVAPSDKGTIKYSLNPEVNGWSDSNWSADIPKRTVAGTYKVYYRAFPSDSDNYIDTFDKANPTFVNATISKLTKADLGDDLNVEPAPDWTYDGKTYKLVDESKTTVPVNTDLRIMYSTNGGNKWDYTIPTGTNAGDYKVQWKTVGNDNIEEISGEFTVHVAKKKPVVEIEPKADWDYNGTTYPLLTVKKNEDNLRFSYSLNGGTAQTIVPDGKNVGTYKVSVSSLSNDNYETYQGVFEIKCNPVSASGAVKANTLTFNYGEQELVTPGEVKNGTMMYRVEGDADYSETIPSRTDAGTYTVWYYVKGENSNYADTEKKSVDVNIAKLKPQTKVNESKDLEYNEKAQTLLTVDTDYGTVQYRVTGDTDYSENIPKRTDAGTYTVEWRVVDADGKSNLDLSDASGTVTVEIAKYPLSINPVSAPDRIYDGEEHRLIDPKIETVNGKGTVKYALKPAGAADTWTPSDSDWKTEVPKAENVGTYTVWYKVDGDNNMKGVDPKNVTVKINKAVPTLNVTVKGSLKHKETAQNLIASADVSYSGKGGGRIMYAVTTTSGVKPQESDWSADQPQRKDNGTYYVWYKFVGDENTESIEEKEFTSVISGDIPEVTISGKTQTYTGGPLPLVEGMLDGAAIDSVGDRIKYWVTDDKTAAYPAVSDTTAWVSGIPERTDAGTYYVWYYVPEYGSELAVGPARVESEIKQASTPDYDYTKGDSAKKKLPEDKFFTVPWGTKLGDINLGDTRYVWTDPDYVLKTIGENLLYDADFTDPQDPDGNYQSGKVKIKVTVTEIREDTPEIEIDYIAETLTGFNPDKIYTLWKNVTHTDGTTHVITDERMNGADAEIVLKASTDHTTDSAEQNLVIPTRPPAPIADEINGPVKVHQPKFRTASGRVEGISADMEYSIGESNTWLQGNGELTLPQNTTLKVRYKAVAKTLTESGSFKSLPLEIKIDDSHIDKIPFGIDAKINYPHHAIVLEPNTKYTITDEQGNKHRVETDSEGEVPIEEDWHLTTVKIVKNGDILYTADSEEKPLYIPPRPDKPTLESENCKITIKNTDKNETYEYRPVKDSEYKDVENGNETKEVTPGKYAVRVEATETSFSSLDALVTVKEKTPDAGIDYENETLNNLVPDSEYIITEPDGNVITVVTDSDGEIPIEENWFGTDEDENKTKKILIQKKGETEDENSEPQTRPIPKRPEPPEPDSWDSKITEVDETMEYRLASDPNDDDYTTVENENETKVVEPNEYEVRYKATEESFASLPASVTVKPLPVPTGSIDYPEVKIKDLEPGAEYTVIDENGDEKTVVADEEGKIPIEEEWIDSDIEIIRNGDDVTKDSEPQKITIPKRPDPPNPSSRDSKITEVDDTMEYRPKGDTDDKYVSVEDNKTESPVVTPGDYAVRIKATKDSFPSLPAYVTVDPLPNTSHTRGGGSGGGGGKTTKPTPTPSPAADIGGDGTNGTDIPELNKTDHFAYISGYEDSTFRPDRTINRGEVAAIFARLMMDTEDAYTAYTPSFPDLDKDMYFYSQVGYLEQYNIITGYEDGTFRPWEPITRTEFSVIASKFAALTETEENVFTDVEDSFWGKPFILLAHKNGWVNGYEDGTFKPQAFITRAEVVSIVNRMLERSCDTDFARNNADRMKVFIDVSDSHWAYNDIVEAANGHLYITEDGSEVWTDLT